MLLFSKGILYTYSYLFFIITNHTFAEIRLVKAMAIKHRTLRPLATYKVYLFSF